MGPGFQKVLQCIHPPLFYHLSILIDRRLNYDHCLRPTSTSTIPKSLNHSKSQQARNSSTSTSSKHPILIKAHIHPHRQAC